MLGATRRSNAAVNAGFTVSARLRPAPARRIRPESAAPLSSSSTPRVTVERAAPVARHHRDPAVPGLTGLHRHPQPTLPLVEHRRQQRKLARDLALTISDRHHITQNKAKIPNEALIYSRVLRCGASNPLGCRTDPGGAERCVRAQQRRSR